MREFIKIESLFKHVYKEKVHRFIDRITFTQIILLWVLIMIVFGTLYHFLTNDSSYLYYGSKRSVIDNFADATYYSFVAATNGFGDISSFGALKIISIIEVFLGLIMLAIATSKLISIKQDVILNELYELSFTDRVNKLRSSLLLFRQNIDRLMIRIEEGNPRRRDVNTAYIYLSSFEDTLRETLTIMEKPTDKNFIKGVDPVNMELIYNSIINSFEKINEFVEVLNFGRIEWRTELNVKLIEECIYLTERLFGKLNLSEKIMKNAVNELNARKNNAIGTLKAEVGKKRGNDRTVSLEKFTNGDAENDNQKD